jgi:dipeptidyl aminopeptidase/acylaminoacyl peptidase
MRKLIFSLAMVMCVCSPARAQLVHKHVLPSVGAIRIQAWAYRSGELTVKGLLFVPEGSARLPTIVFCHDGISGISRQHRLASIRLAKLGFVVFAPSYRGEDGSDGTVEVAKGEVDDVLEAIPLLQKLDRVDGNRIAIVGASHGALIGLLAAARSDQIKSAVLAYGVMDIYRWWNYLHRDGHLGHDAVSERTYGDGPESRPESCVMRNGLTVVPKIKCPVLLLQGGRDEIVPPEQAREMKRALDAAGKPCELQIYPDCLHGFLVYAPYLKHGVKPAERRETAQAWSTMLDFLHRTLR